MFNPLWATPISPFVKGRGGITLCVDSKLDWRQNIWLPITSRLKQIATPPLPFTKGEMGVAQRG